MMDSPESDSDLYQDSNSTPADLTTANKLTVQTSIKHSATATNMEDIPVYDEDADSASDFSMLPETEDDDDGNGGSPIVITTTAFTDILPPVSSDNTDAATEGSKKRKYYDATQTLEEQLQNGLLKDREDRKRSKPEHVIGIPGLSVARAPKAMPLLPPELWQHIFTFCTPKVLAHLLSVNKSFHSYLDPAIFQQSFDHIPASICQRLSPDAIWRASRNLLDLPQMPHPLFGKSELDMWKLACNPSCQFCGKKRQGPYLFPTNQWQPGPGEYGVVPLWSFGVRSCGSCFQKHSIKEIDLLLSSSIPSPLTAALPFVFLTNELHILSPVTLQSSQHPASIQITKHFYQVQINEIKNEFESVKAMGAATAEEWVKGLDSRGKERKNDAARWERWEASGGLLKMQYSGLAQALSRVGFSSTNNSKILPPVLNRSSQGQHASMPQQITTYYPTNQPNHLPRSLHTTFASTIPPRFNSPLQNGFPSFPPQPKARQARTKDEVDDLKAARRAEIERRCMLLDPPITVEVLAHMASFQAAIQIIQPLTDSAWEVLKPRLLSQREEADHREKDRLAQIQVAQEHLNERLVQDAQSMGSESVDKEWDDVQAPLRARIGGYADEIIRDGWQSGVKVNHDTTPKFAAEVLIYVRKRFYAEQAKDEAAIRATGREPVLDLPDGPFTRKLSLENMKWVFDTKIKPHTDSHRKELFLCSACDFITKYYGFEGIVQHFAAKHTSALSFGSVVVHWRAEWPENPPFKPDPDSVVVQRHPYFTPAPASSLPYTTGAPIQQQYGYGGYQPVPVLGPVQNTNPHGYQESPSPYYGHPQFGEQYTGHQNGPYAPPPQAYAEASHGYQTPRYSSAPQAPGHTGYTPQQGNGYIENQSYPQPDFGGPYAPVQGTTYISQPPVQQFTAMTAGSACPPQLYAPPAAQYEHSYSQNAPINHVMQQQRTEVYISQLKFIARAAREVWNAIGNLKVPGSLKVHTIIYHMLHKSRDQFPDEPPLSMIVEGLSSNKDMRPVRNVNGLRCKACSLGMAGSTPNLQKKLFSFPQLVNHFHSIHAELPSDFIGHVPDWTKEMIELPEISQLMSVSRAPGMKEEKLKLFMEALPELFAPEIPPIEITQDNLAYHYAGPPQNEYSQLAPSLDNHDKYYGAVDSGRPSEAGSVTYDSNEYDPRRPIALPVEPRAPFREPMQSRRREREVSQAPAYRHPRSAHETHEGHADYPDRSYVESRPVQSRSMDNYGPVIVRKEPVYLERPSRYCEDELEYRPRSSDRIMYDKRDQGAPDQRAVNSLAYAPNRQELSGYPLRDNRSREGEDTAAQASRILEVVAKISQQAQQARDRPIVKPDIIEGGSEDGELRAEDEPQLESRRPMRDEARNAADRFLNEVRPRTGRSAEDEARRQDELRERYEAENPGVPRRDGRVPSSARYIDAPIEQSPREGLYWDRAPSKLPRELPYEDRYISHPEIVRDRSPETADRRFKPSNIVYRDERQPDHDTHRLPSRYARYESVRLENERIRSGSPVYVKTGPPPSQYRERSLAPSAHLTHQEPLPQEPSYRTRSPLLPGSQEPIYERRPEYRYADGPQPRSRESQYAEAFDYVRVADPAGDYMIRRPVRREPVYYEDDGYARQPVYESNPLAQRMEEPYDGYDPRAPIPGQPPTAARQGRYQ